MTITLYFLQTSRAIRTAYLLEELGLNYNVEYFDREANGDTPANYKEKAGLDDGRSPAINDDGLKLVESGAIAEYLCEKYDKSNKLMPKDPAARAEVRKWMYAAEGTFFVHGLAILYGSGAAPDSADALQSGLSGAVHRDFDWLEASLSKGSGKYLVGGNVTAADTMLCFTVAFILKMGLGTKGKSWPKVEAWLKNIEASQGYQAAVKKTGHKLG